MDPSTSCGTHWSDSNCQDFAICVPVVLNPPFQNRTSQCLCGYSTFLSEDDGNGHCVRSPLSIALTVFWMVAFVVSTGIFVWSIRRYFQEKKAKRLRWDVLGITCRLISVAAFALLFLCLIRCTWHYVSGKDILNLYQVSLLQI